MKIRRSLTSILTCLFLLATLQACFPHVSRAGWGWPWGDESCCAKCPNCHYTCKFSAKKFDAKQHRYVADSKVICIPRVVFPWQTDDRHRCVNNGARLRRVSVLKREYYTCPECDFSWSAKKCGSDADDEVDKAKDKAAKSPLDKTNPVDEPISPGADSPSSLP